MQSDLKNDGGPIALAKLNRIRVVANVDVRERAHHTLRGRTMHRLSSRRGKPVPHRALFEAALPAGPIEQWTGAVPNPVAKASFTIKCYVATQDTICIGSPGLCLVGGSDERCA